MRRLLLLALLLATPAAAQLNAGIAGVAPNAAVHLNGRTVFGYTTIYRCADGSEPGKRCPNGDSDCGGGGQCQPVGAAELRGTELRTDTFPTGHSITFSGTPNLTVAACDPVPGTAPCTTTCTSDGESVACPEVRIQEWTGAKIVFKAMPATVLGGYTVDVTTPRGTSNALPIIMYAMTNYPLPAPNDGNLTSVSRLLVDGFEYGCDGGAPCSLAGTEFSHTQWDFAAISGTPQNVYHATPMNGDAGNNWTMHTDAQEWLPTKTLVSPTTDLSIHFEFCPGATPAAERTIMDFRTSADAVQGYLTFGTDNLIHTYYTTSGSVGPTSSALAVGDTCHGGANTGNACTVDSECTGGTCAHNCYEIALLQDASLTAANCAQLTLYVDGQVAGDAQLCSLTIGSVTKVRLGGISGALVADFDNVVLSGGYDRSVAYLRLADLHPDADSSPNAWTRTNAKSGCTSGANYQCVNDLVPNGQCSGDATAACGGPADCAATPCTYVDGAPLYSVDITSNEGALLSTTTPSNREEFSLTDLTLDDDPVEKFATGSAVGLTCWMQAVNAATDVCYTLTDGTTTTCAGATAVTDAAYSPVTQLSTPSGVPTVCIGGTQDGTACTATTACVDAAGTVDGVCGTDNALHFLLQSPSSTTADTRVRATACVAEVEITKRLPSYFGGNPLPVAFDFDAAGNAWMSAEYSNKLFKLPASTADGDPVQAVDIPIWAGGPFVACFSTACSAGANSSATAEDIDYRSDGGTDEIWFSQGGWWLYGVYGGDDSATNISRVLRYRPTGSPTWQCYPIPTNNEQIFQFVVESNSSLWVGGRTAIWHTDPSAWTAAQKSCTALGAGAPLCGSTPCWDAYTLPTPVNSPYGADDHFGGIYGLELHGSELWVSRYLANELLKFNTSSHAYTQYELPTLALTQRVFTDYVGNAYPDLGNGPTISAYDGTYIWYALWYGNSLARQDLTTGAITTYPIPDTTWEKPHSVVTNSTEVWAATSDEDTISTVWTGTETDGTITGGQVCGSWTSTSSGSGGSYGDITATDTTWTENTSACGTAVGPTRRALYCIEQGDGANKRVFYTSRQYDSNFGGTGGAGASLTNADALCQGRADTMNYGGTWKAWLSDAFTSAASVGRLTHLDAAYDYVLVNGTKVADGWDDLIDGTLDHAIDVSEEGNSGGGRFARLDTAVSPLVVEALPPISAISSSYRSGFSGLASDSTNPFRLCSSMGSIVGTKSIMCLEKQPPPPTWTPTSTPGNTNTPTITPTPVYYENGVLHGLVLSGTTTGANYFQTLATAAVEANADVTTPVGIQFNRTDILCPAGPGSTRVATFMQRDTNADVASCTITGSPSPATCAITGMARDYTVQGNASDRFDMRHTRSLTGGSAQTCTTTTAYKAAGGADEADAIWTGGGASVTTPASATRWCGPTWADAVWSCGGGDRGIAAAYAAILIPAPCTLSAFAITVEAPLPANVTETFTVVKRPKASAPTSAASDVNTDLTTLLNSTYSASVDTACTSNCSVVAGDRVLIVDVTGAFGNAAARRRRWSLACDGASAHTGGLVSFTQVASLASGSTAYGLYNTASSANYLQTVAKAPRAIVARNLYVLIDALGSGGQQKVTLRTTTAAAGPTGLSSSAADSALTCTTAAGTGSGDTWCHSSAFCCKKDNVDVNIAVGDYYTVAVVGQTGSATSTAFVHVAFEESNGN